MSDSRILPRYTDGVAGARAPTALRVEADHCEDLISFGWLRGLKDSAHMLELRKKTGHVLAVGYAWMEIAEYEPSEGIVLYLTDRKIVIRGRNLNAEIRPMVRLFEGITRHRVPWIEESTLADEMEAGDAACVIESIAW
jgi:hypothetical protein